MQEGYDDAVARQDGEGNPEEAKNTTRGVTRIVSPFSYPLTIAMPLNVYSYLNDLERVTSLHYLPSDGNFSHSRFLFTLGPEIDPYHLTQTTCLRHD